MNQGNDVVAYEMIFYSTFNLYSCTPEYPLPVLTVNIREGKKSRATVVSGLTFMWDISATNSIRKRKNIKPYKLNMHSNKVECNKSAGLYCTTHDVKFPFFMPEFFSSKIISNRYILIMMKVRK